MYRCPCGFVFDENLGKHGCPNCEGEYEAYLIKGDMLLDGRMDPVSLGHQHTLHKLGERYFNDEHRVYRKMRIVLKERGIQPGTRMDATEYWKLVHSTLF